MHMSEKKWVDLSGLVNGTDSCGKAAKKTVEKKYNSAGSSDEDGNVAVEVSYKLSGYFELEAPFGQEGFSRFDVPDAGFSTEAGAPMIPREGLFIVIPPGTEFDGLNLHVVSQVSLPRGYNLIPAPPDVLEEEYLDFQQNPEIFSSDTLYPKIPVEYVETLEIMGIKCVHLYVYPFQYRPKRKQVNALTDIIITVNFRHTGLDSGYEPPKIRDSRFADELLGYEEEIDENAIDSEEIESKRRLLIITTTELLPELILYINVKKTIYDVSVALKEEILPLYPDKTELEAIHSYIMAEDKKSQISYLLLGGDVNYIPTRILDNGPNDTKIANDNYYCSSGDRANPYPLFSLGRFPASTPQEMKEMADVAVYYNLFFNNTRKTTIFATQKGHYYVNCTNEIASAMPDDFSIKTLYGGTHSKDELKAEIEKGIGFINYRGHGTNNGWCSKHGLVVKDVEELNVGRNTPHVLGIACSNSGIHEDNCFGSAWIKKAKAISFLGASAPSYTLVNNLFDKYLWEEILKKECTTIGDIFFKATRKLFLSTKHSSDKTKTNILEYLLLGDPTSDYMDETPYKYKIKGINK